MLNCSSPARSQGYATSTSRPGISVGPALPVCSTCRCETSPSAELPPARAAASERTERQPAHALVPYDNEAQVTVLGGTWNDWSDGRERIGSALLLQQLRQHGWGDQSRLQEAFHGYRHFVIDHMVRVDGTVLDHRSDEERCGCTTFPGSPGSCSTPVISKWLGGSCRGSMSWTASTSWPSNSAASCATLPPS
jgi:hypothetical protein